MKDIRDIGYLTRWQVWILDIRLRLTPDIGHLTILTCEDLMLCDRDLCEKFNRVGTCSRINVVAGGFEITRFGTWTLDI